MAAGYTIFALMYLAIAVIFLSAGGWRGIDEVFQNMDIIGGTLLIIFGLFSLNLLLALGSWRVLSFSLLTRRLFLSAAIALAIVVVINNIRGWWRWYQGTLPPDIGPAAVIGGTLVALGYVYLAYSLAKQISTSNKSFNIDAQKTRD